MRKLVFGLMLIVAHFGAQAATILVFGDSLSAGYGIAREKAWPSLLEARLGKERQPFRVTNASISGETSAGGRSRLPALLKEHKPAIVVIELGANDGLRGLPVNEMKKNLDAMIDASRRAHAKVLLIGMKMPPNYGPDYTRQFEGAFSELARGHNIPLVPFLLDRVADKRELLQADGLHPTADAQPILLDTVWPRLKPLLGR